MKAAVSSDPLADLAPFPLVDAHQAGRIVADNDRQCRTPLNHTPGGRNAVKRRQKHKISADLSPSAGRAIVAHCLDDSHYGRFPRRCYSITAANRQVSESSFGNVCPQRLRAIFCRGPPRLALQRSRLGAPSHVVNHPSSGHASSLKLCLEFDLAAINLFRS